MGQGRMLGAQAALDANMIDGVMTYGAVLEQMKTSLRPNRSRLAAAQRDLSLM